MSSFPYSLYPPLGALPSYTKQLRKGILQYYNELAEARKAFLKMLGGGRK